MVQHTWTAAALRVYFMGENPNPDEDLEVEKGTVYNWGVFFVFFLQCCFVFLDSKQLTNFPEMAKKTKERERFKSRWARFVLPSCRQLLLWRWTASRLCGEQTSTNQLASLWFQQRAAKHWFIHSHGSSPQLLQLSADNYSTPQLGWRFPAGTH